MTISLLCSCHFADDLSLLRRWLKRLGLGRQSLDASVCVVPPCAMEVELSCALCCQLLTEPLLLPCCCRAICAACAKAPPADSNDDSTSDKASVYSETDSGVVVASSRPHLSSLSSQSSNDGSAVGVGPPPSILSLNHLINNQAVRSGSSLSQNNTLKCPSCQKMLLLGPDGLSGLVPYPGMSRIVGRFRGGLLSGYNTNGGNASCQLCEGAAKEATTHCVQCKVLYCGACLTSCHPMRGPLSTHVLVPVPTPATPATCGNLGTAGKCTLHGEIATVYCTMCRCVACTVCSAGVHAQHELQPMDSLAKTYKVSRNRKVAFYT